MSRKEVDEEKFEEVEIDLPDDILLKLFKKSHEKDMTFNEYINVLLRHELEKLKAKHDEVNKIKDDLEAGLLD